MSIKPHSVAIGERYTDDSGWQRLVEVQTEPRSSVWVEIDGGKINFNVSDIPWLIEALTVALAAVKVGEQ